MKKLLLALVLSLMALTSQAQKTHYDVNGDGKVNVTDIMFIVNNILNIPNPGDNDASQSFLTCPDNNHPHMIDLGLPSGTKWACCNVDTEYPEYDELRAFLIRR